MRASQFMTVNAIGEATEISAMRLRSEICNIRRKPVSPL
jgi:hypothetical protein